MTLPFTIETKAYPDGDCQYRWVCPCGALGQWLWLGREAVRVYGVDHQRRRHGGPMVVVRLVVGRGVKTRPQ